MTAVAGVTAAETDVLVAYYSRTGHTRRLCERVEEMLGAEVERIRPCRPGSYPEWLLRSFRPGSTVAVTSPRSDPAAYDAVVLGSPKWTLACPPVNGYLDAVALDGIPVVVAVTHRGFAVEPFVDRLAVAVERAGGRVVARRAVHRDGVGPVDGDTSSVAERIAGEVEGVLGDDALG